MFKVLSKIANSNLKINEKLDYPDIAGFTFQQCFAQRSEKLKVDKTAKMIFTSTELKGIEEMIQFVDGLVSDSTEY